MPSTHRLRAIAVVVTLLAAGCVTEREDCVPPELARQSWIDLTSPGEYAPLEPPVRQRLANVLKFDRSQYPDDGRRPLNVLAISGGGKFGAFGVGVLNGWTAAGTRPVFDAVTGISTGALAAPLAFLGPEYDDQARRLFTEIETKDIYDRRRIPGMLIADAIASNEPLKELVAREVTPELLRRVAEEHARGRRLYIGTTNLDSRELVIWDMGPIAARGELELFRNVILASASVPGYFSPIELRVRINGQEYSELHADGSISTSVFVRPYMIGLSKRTQTRELSPAGTKVWVLVNGKLFIDPGCVRQKPFPISTEAISGLLYTLTRNDIGRISTLCLLAGAKLNVASLPVDVEVNSDSLTFEPPELRRLFEEGYRLGRHGEAGWSDNIPALLEEHHMPRTGLDYATSTFTPACDCVPGTRSSAERSAR